MSTLTPRTVRLIVAAFVLLFAVTLTANADTITVSGNTQGNFNGGTTSSNPTLGSINIFGTPALEFAGQPFSQSITTGAPAVQITVGTFDLHTFHGFNFSGQTFNLVVTFTNPPGSPGGPQSFNATLAGTVEVFDFNETININFNNTPQVFSYSGGTFSFSVLDLNSLNEQDGFVNLRANISAVSQTPEPVSLFLLGTGITGLTLKLRSRRNAKSQPID